MAGEIYLFSRSYSHDLDAVATTDGTSGGANTPDRTNDYLFDTFWETADATPQLKIDLGEERTIDSLWFRSANVSKYRLYYSTDDISYSPAFDEKNGNASGNNWQIQFTEQSAQYWRLDITQETTPTQNTLIYEVFLMEHRLTIDEANAPRAIVPEWYDSGGGGYELADGSYVGFEGLSERGKMGLRLEFEYATLAFRNDWYSLWLGPPRRQELTIFPFPDDFPGLIYRVGWKETGLAMPFSTNYTGAGYSFAVEFHEV